MIAMLALLPLLASAASPDRPGPLADDSNSERNRRETIQEGNSYAVNACLNREGCVLTFAAAASRGAYQAGAAYTLIKKLRERGKPLRRFAVSGSSAGALNALMAALLWCMRDEELERETPTENFMVQTWADLNLDSLFPGDRNCVTYSREHPELGISCSPDSPYQEGDAVFTRNAFLSVRERLVGLLDSRRFRPNCRVPIAIALTSERQTFVSLGTQSVPTSRRTLIFELRTRPEDPDRKPGGIHVCQSAPAPAAKAEANPLPDQISHVDALLSIRLPEVIQRTDGPCNCRWVDRQALLDAMTASASLPPFLAPQQLDFCANVELGCRESPRRDLACPKGTGQEAMKLCQERFIDGGIFDNRPVTAGREVSLIPWLPDSCRELSAAAAAGTPEEGSAGNTFVVVGAGPVEEGTALDGSWQTARGITFYRKFFTSFFEVGRQYELQTLLRYEAGLAVEHIEASQWLVADYLFGYGALLDRRFIMHDYLAGLCFDELPALRSELPCSETRLDIPDALRRDIKRVHLALSASRDRKTSRPLEQLEAFMETLRTGDRGACRFASSSPPIWCTSDETTADGKFQHLPGDGNAEDLPYISRFDTWSYELAQRVLNRAEVVERRDHNDGLAVGLAAGGLFASMEAADLLPGGQLGSFTVIPARARTSFTGRLALLVPSSIGVESMYYGRTRLDWSLMSFRASAVRIAAGAFLELPRGTWALASGPFLELWTRAQALPRLGDMGVRARYDVNGDRDWKALRPEIFIRPFLNRVELNLSLQLGPIVSRHPPARVGFGIALTDVNGLLYWAVRSLAGRPEF